PHHKWRFLKKPSSITANWKKPPCELLFDWGTTNCTVGDLVDILVQNEFFAPASILLPDAVPKNVNTLPSKVTVTVQQKPKPLCGKDKTSVISDEILEQNYVLPDSSSPENTSLEFSDTRFHSFSFFELKDVTNNFDEWPISVGGNKMGGGFGVVYKGYCQHENLVELLGFSSDGDDLCLVYVYMPSGSLLDRLSCLDGTPQLSWYMRCKIAQGETNGLTYLHENHHNHRDIKSANILLDEDFTAKISDFGLAWASEKFAQSVMTSRIVGTTVYMAPEALRGEITPKSDIYSFGVVLLEIITGLPAVDEHHEPQLLQLNIKEEIEDEEKTIEDYIDKKMNDVDSTSIETMYSVASQCLHEKKNKRPDIKK
ncbi:hypothetical protein FD755_019650, partial [Muntiacus reevesi]